MNAPVTNQAPALPANAQTSALVLDPAAMQNMVAFADFMCKSVITVPKHLQGNSGDCLAITMQAMQWGMNPFAVAQKTHLVNGNLGYEAQLVNAVIINRAPIIGRPDYQWFGDWSKVDGKTCKDPNIGVTVSVVLKGENLPRTLDVSFAQVGTTRNSPNWVNDPKQQIAYLAIKKLSRLHFPDVILGVYTEDELQDSTSTLNVTPDDGFSQEYALFEEAHLNNMRELAFEGMEALETGYAELPKGKCRSHFWTMHKESLKAAAQKADQPPGEVYEHSAAE
ncbi:RecT family recombinase [Acinetobacter guillouiae]|uniref:RecT family recombinase n=1 Tax=Acinetobacter guillouiae TaxID=106649 RepID=UPI003AF6F241